MTFLIHAAKRAAVHCSLILSCLALAGCVASTHGEDAALRGDRPTGQAKTVAGPVAGGAPFPSLAGDILADASPESLARARAAQSEALTRALAKP
jgi:hypothetical protein